MLSGAWTFAPVSTGLSGCLRLATQSRKFDPRSFRVALALPRDHVRRLLAPVRRDVDALAVQQDRPVGAAEHGVRIGLVGKRVHQHDARPARVVDDHVDVSGTSRVRRTGTCRRPPSTRSGKSTSIRQKSGVKMWTSRSVAGPPE